MNDSLVSIVIPTYNQAKYLKIALDSVIKQTHSNWEAIIINNFSEDDTIQVVESFQDSRIQLVNYRNNGVIGASRNRGINLAKGDYVSFLDSDDFWYPDKLKESIIPLLNEYDMVCHAELFHYETGFRQPMYYGPESASSYYNLLFHGNCISTSATMVNKFALMTVGGFSEEKDFILAEDYELWLKLAKEGFRCCFINKLLGEYRVHELGASKRLLKHMSASLAVLNKHHDNIQHKTLCHKLKFRIRCSRVITSALWGVILDKNNKSKPIITGYVDHSSVHRYSADKSQQEDENMNRQHTFGEWYNIKRALVCWPFNWRIYVIALVYSALIIKFFYTCSLRTKF